LPFAKSGRFSWYPVDILSTPNTGKPCSLREAAIRLPINPAMPVIKIAGICEFLVFM